MLDEIGYWSSAAYFKGYNWSGVIGNFAAYYSYGYGFLLYLFMSMAKEPHRMSGRADASFPSNEAPE